MVICFDSLLPTLPRWWSDKKSTCQCKRHKRHRFLISWVGKIHWRRQWQATPEFLPESPWTEEPGRLQRIQGVAKSRVRFKTHLPSPPPPFLKRSFSYLVLFWWFHILPLKYGSLICLGFWCYEPGSALVIHSVFGVMHHWSWPTWSLHMRVLQSC